MTNAEIARVFTDIAALLKVKKENVFKIRAYETAAGYILEWPASVEQLATEGRLGEIPGVGEAISKKITELVTSGRLEYYEKLKAELTNSPPLKKSLPRARHGREMRGFACPELSSGNPLPSRCECDILR